MCALRTIGQLDAGISQCVVTYGTSLTEGGAWVDELRTQLQERYPGRATVINSGKNGMWSEWGVQNLSERVLDHNPDMVFIEFAINDAYLPYETSLEQSRSRLEHMISSILEKNDNCDIVLMTMNPPVGDSLEIRPNFHEYYEVYRSVAKEKNLPIIDHFVEWSALYNQDRALFDRWIPDSIHPIPEGSIKVTAKGIEKFLFPNLTV
ncbi:SGNH/GDSL hydrolase family protein [Paenibacillus sp. KQZ6P-2]|uniref:SGNH/GDSL hydrolase family protein n=1 Tax=Paenibacillus mangrovi TaxID=2931978 RepID=A0A9X2B2Y1_9BACL|nr:SGNH/GDSL hydrolase family protein [Paenibacillus mangrovi]MCJ8013004.1 SGNH/GDSL hydrolase family protein [Paenibacillus mangrovi]